MAAARRSLGRMQGKTPESRDPLAARVVELETLITHVQRTLGELDQVVLAQQKQIDALGRKIDGLSVELHARGTSTVEGRKPEDEKPPHY